MASFRSIMTIFGIVAALILVPAVSASPLTTGTGTGTIGIRSITSGRSADGNVIQERDLEGTVTGALDGTFTEHVRGVVHSTGLVTFQGTMTFTGTVAGCGYGTVTLGVSGQGVTGAPISESSVRVIDDASNTIDVNGQGTVSQSGPFLTYEVRYFCK